MPKGVYKKKFEWTDDMVKVLRNMAGKYTCAEIAKVLNRDFGTCFTRNAIVGKQHRLGLVARLPNKVIVRKARNNKRENETAKARYRAKKGVNVVSVNAARKRGVGNTDVTTFHKDPVVKSEFNKTFSQLFAEGRATMVPFAERGERQCSWPVQGDGPTLMCCGEHTRAGKPYCVAHASIARPYSRSDALDFGVKPKGHKPSGFMFR